MRLLITGAWREAKSYIPKLEKAGYDVIFMQQEADRLPCDPSSVEGVVCNGLFLYHDIHGFNHLRFIQLTSAGLDRVPVEYIRKNDIALYNARGVYSVPMAEHALTAVLNIYRNSRSFYENQAKRIWKKERELRELCGKNVCVIGCGSVGTECARRFSAFGCEVTGIDLYPVENLFFDSISGIGELYDVIPKADVVVLTLPLNDQTEGIVGDKFLSFLKPGCVIVNISRGKIIDTGALISALSKYDLFAALDVFEEEPLDPGSPLWDMQNVIVTPHNSFVGEGNAKRLAELILKNLVGVIDAEGFDNGDGSKSYMPIS